MNYYDYGKPETKRASSQVLDSYLCAEMAIYVRI